MYKKVLFVITLLALCSMAGGSASAVSYTWSNTGSGAWSSGANWYPAGGPPASGDIASINNGGTAVIDGINTPTAVALMTVVGASGSQVNTLDIAGGTSTFGYFLVAYNNTTATGIVNQSAGTVNVTPYQIWVGSPCTGFYNLSGGNLNLTGGGANNDLEIGVSGGNGTFTQTGGVLTTSGSVIALGTRSLTSSGTYLFEGGSITQSAATNLSVGTYTSAGQAATGIFRGKGAVGLTGTLTNNGKVIADGFGADATLDMSSFSALANGATPSGAGWYAQNHGALKLPGPAVAAGDHTYTWGYTTNLINAVQMTFHSATAGTVSGLLISADSGTLPTPAPANVIGVWNFDPGACTFSKVDMTLRYNDAVVSSPDLPNLVLLQLQGSQWVDIGGTVNTGAHTLTYTGLTSLGYFAIGLVPKQSKVINLQPGECLLLRIDHN